jgi:hypothetical protein
MARQGPQTARGTACPAPEAESGREAVGERDGWERLALQEISRAIENRPRPPPGSSSHPVAGSELTPSGPYSTAVVLEGWPRKESPSKASEGGAPGYGPQASGRRAPGARSRTPRSEEADPTDRR